jgi:NAD(P)-dependent dehydrogenase (short-subunit alcohol dehydrogenase family)
MRRATVLNLSGRFALVTGANTGIGLVTARVLAAAGADVTIACRSPEKAAAAVASVAAASSPDRVHALTLDLSSLASAKDAAAAFVDRGRPLHLLINNAGVAGVRGVTQDGYELAFGTNHLGHYVLTERLLPLMLQSASGGGARIVNVASAAHYRAKGIDFSRVKQSTASVSGLDEYAVSKLCNVLYAKDLAARLAGHGVTASSLHPGVVASDIWQRRLPVPIAKLIGLFMIDVEDGAQTTLHCAVAPDVQGGAYYDDCALKKESLPAQDDALRQQLMTYSQSEAAAFLA